jgi:hypothetical protein
MYKKTFQRRRQVASHFSQKQKIIGSYPVRVSHLRGMWKNPGSIPSLRWPGKLFKRLFPSAETFLSIQVANIALGGGSYQSV